MKRSTNRQMTKIPRRAFPRHLAKLARERWDQLVAGDYSPPPCPPEKLLRELFEVVYLTASAPEEDRYPKFNLVASLATDGGDQQEIGRRSQFVERRPLSVAELRRLAPAVD